MSTFSRKQKRNVGIGGVIMILMIIVVFVFWGGSASRIGGSNASVIAKVNGTSITKGAFQKRLLQRVQAFESQLNQNITPEMLKQLRIPEQVLNQMINELLIQQEAKRYGLQVSNQELTELITSAPIFQDDKGIFSVRRYKYQLARLGLTPTEYEEQVKDQLLSSKLTGLITDAIFTSDEESRLYYMLREEKIDLDVVKIETADLVSRVPIIPSALDNFIATNELAIRDYYETHLEEFKTTDGKKSKELSEVHSQIAEKLLKEQLAEERAKDLSLEVLDAWKNSKPITSVLAPYNIKPASTGYFSRATTFIPQIGRSDEVATTAFSLSKSRQFPTAPIYVNGSWVVIKFRDSKGATLADFAKQEAAISKDLRAQKTNEAYRLLFAAMQTRAKITKRPLEDEPNLFQ